MTSIRLSLMALLVTLLVVGCGGSSATTDPGNGTGAAAPADTVGGTEATPDSAGNGAGTAEDVVSLGEALVPPNSSEMSKTTTESFWYVQYELTDSPDSLKSHYENEIPKSGMKIISTTSASGAHSMAFARDESGSFGGSVTIGPSGTGGPGSTVIVAVGG